MSYDDDDFIIDYDQYDKICYDEDQRAWFACERDGTVIPESKCDTEDDAIDYWWEHVYDPDVDDEEPDESEDDQEPNESEDNSEDESDNDSDNDE